MVEIGMAKFKSQLVEDIQQEWELYKQEQGAPNTPTVKMVRDFVQSKTNNISGGEIANFLTSAGAKSTQLGRALNRRVAWNAIEEILKNAEIKQKYEDIIPKEGDTIEASGFKLNFDGERWTGVNPAGSRIVPKNEMQARITDIWRKKEAEKKEPTGDKLSDKAEAAGLDDATQVPQKSVADHIEQERGASEEKTAEIMQDVGADSESKEPIGDKLEPLTKVVNDAEAAGEFDEEPQEETADIMDVVETEMGKYFQIAKEAGKEVVSSGNFESLSELERYGLAVLISGRYVRS